MTNARQLIMSKVRFLTAKQGGRDTPVPVGALYRPLLDLGLLREDDVPQHPFCQIVLGTYEGIRLGDERMLLIETPAEVVAIPSVQAAIRKGTKFKLREGARVVAEGGIRDINPPTIADYIADMRATIGRRPYVVVVRVQNDRADPTHLALEPTGMVVPMPSGVAYNIVAAGPAQEWRPEPALQIDVADDYTTVWAESGISSLSVFYHGSLVYSF